MDGLTKKHLMLVKISEVWSKYLQCHSIVQIHNKNHDKFVKSKCSSSKFSKQHKNSTQT